MSSVFVILLGIAIVLFSTVIATVVGYWMVTKLADWLGK